VKELVVDSSVAIKWFVPQHNSPKAREILDAFKDTDLAFLAPDLIYAEVGNVIWKLHRFQGVSQVDTEAILNTFQAIDFVITPSSSLLADAYRLAIAHQRTVYDSLYLALSLERQCQFVTGDEKLVNSVCRSFPNVITIENWSQEVS
jgi:predicted nucleic acid-binding protein